MLSHLVLGLLLASPQAAAALDLQNPMELNAEMRAFLDTKVDRGLPQMERLQALVSAVFQDPQLNFTYAPETRTAVETFTNRSGNCLSFTILFVSMARYLGLDAKFREVEIAPIWSKAGAFVNLAQHVNAAVFIGGQAYSIDVFPGVNPIEIGGQVVSDARGMAHFFNNKGVDEMGHDNLDQAEIYLRKALELDPTTVSVWINLGAARTQAGKLAEAEKFYRKALQLDSHNPAAMSNLATVCELTGRPKEAALYQKKIREFREKNPYHHYNLGQIAFQEGKYDEAIAHYRRAIKLKSKEHNFYYALARVYAQLNQTDEVMANLQLAEKYASDPSKKQRYSQKLELLRGIRSQSPIH